MLADVVVAQRLELRGIEQTFGREKMSLVSMKNILKDAQDRKYIVGYFEAWDYSSLNATVKAAEEMKSVIIIGFGGRSFKTSAGWDEVKLASFASMGKIVAQNSSLFLLL